MKNITNVKGIILVIFLTLTISCGEDFLIEDPMSFLSPENTFTNAAGLQTALDAAYKGVFNQWNGDNEELLFNHNMSEASVVSCTDKQDAFVDLRTYMNPLNDRDNDAGRSRSFYEENYDMLKSCNTVIDYIDIPDWTDGVNNVDRNHLLGSAYFLRAFYYMQLTMQFGNVAFPLNVVAESRQDFKAFHMQGIWDQMITDLEYAVQHVKPASQIPKGQAPKDAARMLLAKYYMLNLKFAEAEALMNDVINGSESKLFTDADIPSGVTTVRVGNNYNYNDNGALLEGKDVEISADAVNYMHQNEDGQKLTNKEGVWIVVNTQFLEGSQGRSASIRAWGPNFVSTKFGVKAPPDGALNAADIAQDGLSPMMIKYGRSQGFGRPTNYSQFYIWQFNGETDRQDYRHKPGNWFDMTDLVYDNPLIRDSKDPEVSKYWLQPMMLWGPTGTLLCEDSVRCWYGYPLFKFYAANLEDRPERSDGGKREIYIFRVAEAYLIRAEARFWQDNHSGAADDINILRARANSIHMYTAGDVTRDGIGAILDERCRELFGEEYRHDELVRMSVIFAKSGKTAYNGTTYPALGTDYEKSLSSTSFYYDRQMEKNDFFRENTPWIQFPEIRYTMDPMHIFWPVYEPYLVGNVQNVLNQTTGYTGSANNVEPLVHVVQPAGVPNEDPMEAIGER